MWDRIVVASLTTAVALTTAVIAYAADSSRAAFRTARDAGCVICHDVESLEGGGLPKAPTFEDVACRYRSDPDAAGRLAAIVRDGSGPLRRDRHWTGRVMFETMYPNDLFLTEAEARQIVDWIMTLCPKSASADDRHNKRR